MAAASSPLARALPRHGLAGREEPPPLALSFPEFSSALRRNKSEPRSRWIRSECSLSKARCSSGANSFGWSRDPCSLSLIALDSSRSFVLGAVSRPGSRPSGSRPRPRPSPGNQRYPQDNGDENKGDAPLINEQIRVPSVRLIGQDQAMLGVVSIEEALFKAVESDLDLVMIAPDAEPPVVRIMDYSKYRYEMQKKKREQQKKAAANRQEIKELKMRYNIDTHDYGVRLKAAQRFLADGDKVKVTIQFRGRELDFKDLGVQLFDRFQTDIADLATVESSQMEGRIMQMVFNPTKVPKAEKEKKASSKPRKKSENNNAASDSDSEVDADVDITEGESELEEAQGSDTEVSLIK